MIPVSDALPTLVNYSQIFPFNFYLDGSIKPGMRYGSNLYGKAYTSSIQDRLSAFDFATQLATTGCVTVITVSKENYQVWVQLQAPKSPHWQTMATSFLESLLNQYSFAKPTPLHA